MKSGKSVETVVDFLGVLVTAGNFVVVKSSVVVLVVVVVDLVVDFFVVSTLVGVTLSLSGP